MPENNGGYGWVLEVDPMDPDWTPRTHTNLGRLRHENATVWAREGRHLVVYTGDDARDKFLYEYVFGSVPNEAESTGPIWTPRKDTMFLAIQHPGEETSTAGGVDDRDLLEPVATPEAVAGYLVESQSGVVAPLASRTGVPAGARLEVDPERAEAPVPGLVVVPFKGHGFPRPDLVGDAELHLRDARSPRSCSGPLTVRPGPARAGRRPRPWRPGRGGRGRS